MWGSVGTGLVGQWEGVGEPREGARDGLSEERGLRGIVIEDDDDDEEKGPHNVWTLHHFETSSWSY